tara:strand:- start:884 stop:1906 length:1023 start_codon:yes stop_codon:yes gene_type:complete
MPIIISDDPNGFSSWVDSSKHIYTILHKLAASSGGSDVLEVNDNLVLEGTTNASTSQAIYGVNVITTSTTSDLATRLPAPTTGKQTVFINNSVLPILVFPSVVGGEINGVVDGLALIPNDGRAYTFYCIENPLPGAWTWSPPATSQIELQEMEINHTLGADSNSWNAGQGNPNFASLGLGWGGTGINFTGEWNTELGSKTVVKFKCYTNVKWADIVNTSNPHVQAAYIQGYQNAPTGTTTGQKATAIFVGSGLSPFNDIQEVTTGTVGNNVGDIGTLYMEIPFYGGYPLWKIIGDQGATTPIAGNNGEVIQSPGYYSFGMFLDATVQTKLYKFKWFMECV